MFINKYVDILNICASDMPTLPFITATGRYMYIMPTLPQWVGVSQMGKVVAHTWVSQVQDFMMLTVVDHASFEDHSSFEETNRNRFIVKLQYKHQHKYISKAMQNIK